MSCQLRLTAFSLMTSASQFPEIADAMQRAAQSHRAGNLDEAERIYRDVLARVSDQFAALHALSVITAQRSDFLRAHELLQRTLAMARATAALCRGALNRGTVLSAMERAAYIEMCARQRRGEAPASFAIAPFAS